MNKIHKMALEYMEKSGTELHCNDFPHLVEVIHQDHSHFTFQNAISEVKRFSTSKGVGNHMLLVWTEHCGCYAFFTDDLEWWHEYEHTNNYRSERSMRIN